MTRLVPASLSHFDWAISEPGAQSKDGLRLPAAPLETPDVLVWLKRTAEAMLVERGETCAWLVADADAVMGLISFKAFPEPGFAEIGYGISEACRGRGHATRAVALVIDEAVRLGVGLCAETAAANLPSQIVLERNGFAIIDTRDDTEDGRVLVWWRAG